METKSMDNIQNDDFKRKYNFMIKLEKKIRKYDKENIF